MISVIIPTKNEEKRLPLLLESIKRQNFFDLEVIISDAGSSDATLDIAKKYNCVIIKGGLPGKGKNEGAKIAKGDLLLFLDADVILPVSASGPSFFEKVVSEFSRKNFDLASFYLKPYQYNFKTEIKSNRFLAFLFSAFYNFPALVFEPILPHAAMGIMVKKDMFLRVLGFNEDIFLAEDHYLARKVKKAGGKCGFFRSAKIFVSDRRFRKDGWLRVYFKLVLAEFYMIFLGPIKKDVFKYEFDGYPEQNNLTIKQFNNLTKNSSNMENNINEEKINLPNSGSEGENLPKIGKKKPLPLVFIIIICGLFGFLVGAAPAGFMYYEMQEKLDNLGVQDIGQQNQAQNIYSPKTLEEQSVVNVVKEVSPAVVSIIVSKNLPVYEQYYVNPFGDFGQFGIQIPQYKQNGTQLQEIGGGTGFIISKDGTILTNKHVASDNTAEYTVFTNDGKKYSAKILAQDPVQDLAVLKIDQSSATGDKKLQTFPVVKLGDSDSVQIGQTAIAIGNALGEFRNTVSAGVISGVGRTISASGATTQTETLDDVLQTDAAINEGNSGGPLLNLNGEVIGINTAMATGAQSIGFAIPINKAKSDISQVAQTGKIVYPFLGVRYIQIDSQVQKDKKLSVDYGVLISSGQNGEAAVTAGSAAQKAGLKSGDIILELNGSKITTDNPLAKMIDNLKPGDKITLKILRNGKEQTLEATLGERTE